jgi:hypothetical protein
MASSPGEHFTTLIDRAQQTFQRVQIIRHEIGLTHALLDFEAQWLDYRIIVSEIHRANGQIRYAYYVLSHDNRLIHGFDNSRDVQVVKLRHGEDWKDHLQEEIPHQHDGNGEITLTDHLSFPEFAEWIRTQFPNV